jgi:hypothetical protein
VVNFLPTFNWQENVINMATPLDDKLDRVLAYLEQVNAGLQQLRNDSHMLRTEAHERLRELQGRLDAMDAQVSCLEAAIPAGGSAGTPPALDSPAASCHSSFESS